MATRIIPAYAGSTPGGGWHWNWALGSSPHTRGALVRGVVGSEHGGIIPAYAGSTPASRDGCWRERDHPRIRGEHPSRAPSPSCFLGSSPHTRGARRTVSGSVDIGRIIPAYAGSTYRSRVSWDIDPDHPRIRGEHLAERLAGHVGEGSSPHTRGARKRRSDGGILGRIIPAYAGSTAKSTSSAWRGSDHPRIRGEHANTK